MIVDSNFISLRTKIISDNITILLACVSFLVILQPTRLFCQEENRSPSLFSFEQIMTSEGIIDWAFGDFDGDGSEEVAATDGRGVVVSDFIGSSLRSAADLVGRLTVHQVQALDVDGDSFPEICIGILSGRSVWTEIWSCSSDLGRARYSRYLRTEPVTVSDRNRDGRWDGSIVDYEVIDVNDDEYADVIALFSTGYDIYPRGLLAFDGRTGRKLWEFPLAGHPYLQNCSDMDGDGQPDIVISDRAPCNGNRAKDMDDCHSNILCLNRHGELMWNYETGGVFTQSFYAISEMTAHGSKKVICTFASGDQADESTHFELQVRDGRTGVIEYAFTHPSEFGRPFTNDFDRDGYNEVIAGSEDGWLYLFDHNLEILKKARIASGLQKCGVAEVVDINNDGKEEITVMSHNKLLVLDEDLKVLGTHVFGDEAYGGAAHYFHNPYYGGCFALLGGRKAESRKGVILRMIPQTSAGAGTTEAAAGTTEAGAGTPGKEQSTPVFYLAILAAGVIAAGTGLMLFPVVVRKLRFTTSLRPEDLRDRLLETLSVFGHGKAATANLDRLSFLFKNLTEEQFSSVEYGKKIEDTIQTYRDFTAPKLVEITDRAKLVDVERGQLKKLEKNLGSLDTLIEKYSREHSEFGRVAGLKRRIPELVEEVEENVKAMMKHLAGYYSCDISRAASGVFTALSSTLSREGIHLDIQSYRETGTAYAFIDKSDFTAILEELMNNAVFSMKGSEEKKITVKLTFEPSRIIVEVCDTGCGIPEEDHEKIFDREFSTKKEGGFGLYHAKTTLSKYGGKIKVADSEPGRGTTVRMELRRM